METEQPTLRRVAVIGAGTMGRAIASGIVQAGVIAANRVAVVDRTAATAEALARDLSVVAMADIGAACDGADVVLLCVKPKDVHDVVAHGPLFISIAAGVRIAAIEQVLNDNTPVIRAMPNTPCSIGRGMTVVSRGTHATEGQLETARAIFSTVGRCIALEEKHLDVVTALSASGPGFIYVVMEALADGGVMCGLPRNVATELAAQATLGAAEMVLATGRHPASLKDDVTTPGGCTIAGLLLLEDNGVRSALARTIELTTRVAAGLG
jgi:pyrroline-5-carboxylate reductase